MEEQPSSKVLLLEPFFTGSHKQWALGFQQFSRHEIQLLTMKGKHWKWRMYGAAVTLAQQFMALEELPDVIIASDMLDVSTFLGLTRSRSANIPCYIYFHENQLTYPWNASERSDKEQRDYSFINFSSALAADKVFFNSAYHKSSFINALPSFLRSFPDYKNLDTVPIIEKKASVLPLGLDLKRFDNFKIKKKNTKPLLLWNHRWEYDKNPTAFFEHLYQLKAEGVAFEVAILGEGYSRMPDCFQEAQIRLAEEIVHFGFAENFEAYAKWLWQADVLYVTSNQDFFGGSIVEAMYCDCYPLLPHRLAYPEHLPDAEHHYHFYKNDNDGYTMLKAILKEKKYQRLTDKSVVENYDWQTIIEEYDKQV